jgi:predicted transcriptional regulator
MEPKVDPEAAMRMATEIVVAYLNKGSVPASHLPSLVREVRAALLENIIPTSAQAASPAPSALSSLSDIETAAAEALAPAPAVDIGQSVSPDLIVCLEDGHSFRSLRRHLMAKHGLTPLQYRAKWALPPDYPMVAKSYADERSEVAKRTGLGKRSGSPAKPSRTRRGK